MTCGGNILITAMTLLEIKIGLSDKLLKKRLDLGLGHFLPLL